MGVRGEILKRGRDSEVVVGERKRVGEGGRRWGGEFGGE